MSEAMLVATLLMAVGLVGSVLPLVPGPPLIWLGALYYGWHSGWQVVGWPSLTLLFVLALVGGTADLWMGYLGANRGGASAWATLASIVGGLVGFLVLSVPGALIGAIGAIAAVEFGRHRDWRKVLRASGGYLVGSLLSSVAEVVIALIMIGLFIAAVNV